MASNMSISLWRWLETAVLRLAYDTIQVFVGGQSVIGNLRRRVVVFTVLALSVVVIVMVAAVPVAHYLFGHSFQVSATETPEDARPSAAETKSVAQPALDKSTENSEQVSPFASLGSLNGVAGVVEKSSAGKKETALEHAAKHADPTYVCPMHSDVTSNKAGQSCPICGMKLVLMDTTSGEGGAVQISSATLNTLGVRTESVNRRNVYRKVDSVGYIAQDEDKVQLISLRTGGWIERLKVKAAGETVRKGDLLFEVYSPELVNAQDEYVQALQLQSSRLIQASEERLRALGVSDRQIITLRQNKKPQRLVAVYSPQDGIVADLMVREGKNISPSDPVMSLVDLSTVWLLVDVFERQADWVKIGQQAQASLPFMPNKTWKGTVDYVYPTIDPKTRSLKVRLRFDNSDFALKPNMYADVRILASPKKDVLAIPREAVIDLGKERRVIVALGEGKFIPMPVTTGFETDNVVEVLTGLREGDEVVVSSQFLIDSEASMKAAMMRLRQ